MRLLLVVAGVLVVLAGTQLFVFTERTATHFAWTVDPPLTAAFLGAAYWSAAAFEWSAATARPWVDARIAVPAVFVFTVLTLVTTLVHLDRFHLGSSFGAGTQAVTWTWIAIYATVPVLMLVVGWRQQRAPGADPPRSRRLPAWLRVVVAVQATVLLVAGGWLLLLPAHRGWWPWALTELTARAIGAWAFSLGIAAAHALWEDDVRRVRPAAVAYLAFALLEAVAALRYPDDGDWSSVGGVLYLGYLATSAVVGAAALWYGRSDATAGVTTAPVPEGATVTRSGATPRRPPPRG